MMASLKSLWDSVRGNGEHAITTPPMDGVLQPNNLIEEAPGLAAIHAPDNLVCTHDGLFVSSGSRLMRIEGETPTVIAEFEAEITAMAASGTGALAVATADGAIRLRGGAFDARIIGGPDKPFGCVTALCFADEKTVLFCQGSSRHPLRDWKRDLMERNALGSVHRLDLVSGETRVLAAELAFPYGILPAAGGGCIVSESWCGRLIRIDAGGGISTVLSDLPGYPARLSPKTGGGAWLAVFAPRSQLIEFILRETRFREQMMATIDPDLWIAPSLTAPKSFLEPLQGGGLKQLGVMKPWAPTRSFGLVIALNGAFQPTASWHSRADGTRHGITGVVERNDQLVAASKGGNVLVSLASTNGSKS
jgi:hypothetical protein